MRVTTKRVALERERWTVDAALDNLRAERVAVWPRQLFLWAMTSSLRGTLS